MTQLRIRRPSSWVSATPCAGGRARRPHRTPPAKTVAAPARRLAPNAPRPRCRGGVGHRQARRCRGLSRSRGQRAQQLPRAGHGGEVGPGHVPGRHPVRPLPGGLADLHRGRARDGTGAGVAGNRAGQGDERRDRGPGMMPFTATAIGDTRGGCAPGRHATTDHFTGSPPPHSGLHHVGRGVGQPWWRCGCRSGSTAWSTSSRAAPGRCSPADRPWTSGRRGGWSSRPYSRSPLTLIPPGIRRDPVSTPR